VGSRAGGGQPQLSCPTAEGLHVVLLKLLRDNGCSLAIARLPEFPE